MRSRFSAYALRDGSYLLRTWHAKTRPARIGLDPTQQWTRLEVLATTGGSAFHAEGVVEFRAHYSERGRSGSMHERSSFVRDEEGHWVYLADLDVEPELHRKDR